MKNTGLAKCGNLVMPISQPSVRKKRKQSVHFILTVVKEILSRCGSRSTASQIVSTRAGRQFKDLSVGMSALNSHFEL